MAFFLSFPDEVLVNILHFIPTRELDNIFLLENVHHSGELKSYYQILALHSKYYKGHVQIANDVLPSLTDNTLTSLSLAEFSYLIQKHIYIRPKEINFAVFGKINSRAKVELYLQDYLPLNDFVNEYADYFQKLQTQFNIQLILLQRSEEFERDAFPSLSTNATSQSIFDEAAFNTLVKAFNSRIKSLAIEYRFVKKSFNEESDEMSLDDDQTVATRYDLIENERETAAIVENLKIHLFDSNALVNHLQFGSCITCNSLQSLDLSYNNISDSVLSGIKFPSSLRHLNLSNNDIYTICFTIGENLETLNLSNNRLISLSSPQRSNSMNNVKTLNLSCNYLKSQYLTDMKQFHRLTDFNLSRNLITYFPQVKLPMLKKLNLSGNQISTLTKKCIPSSVIELDLSYCKVAAFHERYRTRKLKVIVV